MDKVSKEVEKIIDIADTADATGAKTAPAKKSAEKPVATKALNDELNNVEIVAGKVEPRTALSRLIPKPDIVELEAGGIKYKVNNYLPPEEKLQLANTIAAASVILNEDAGRAFSGTYKHIFRALHVVKAYTDIDIDFSDPLAVYDVLVHSGILFEVQQHMWRDMDIIDDLVDNIADTIIAYYNATHSVDYYMRKMAEGNHVGEELLGIIEQSASKASATAIRIDEAMKQAAPSNMFSFSKRKKD